MLLHFYVFDCSDYCNCCCCFLYLQIIRNRGSYFTGFYNILDLVIIISSVCSISFSIYRSVTVNQSLQNLVTTSDIFVDLSGLSMWQIIFNCTLAITLFLAWLKVIIKAIFSYGLCLVFYIYISWNTMLHKT